MDGALECGVTNQSSSIIDFQWFPLCIKINAFCLVMHYANWLIESQVWELLFKSQFGFSTDCTIGSLQLREKWYFVTKIVLTYCEKKIVLVIKNFQKFLDH